MFSFIVKRLLQSILVMATVGIIAFGMFRFVGDPIDSLVGQDTSHADREALREQLGLNDPFLTQFWRYLVGSEATGQNGIINGDFGISYTNRGLSVAELLSARMPATLELALTSSVLALVLGIPLGVFTALNWRFSFKDWLRRLRESSGALQALRVVWELAANWLSRFVMVLSLIGVSLPTFLIGVLMIYWLGVELQWLPTFGRGDAEELTAMYLWRDSASGDPLWRSNVFSLQGWKYLVMPATTLALFQMTLIMRLVRAEMLEVLRTDYVKFARARGLKRSSVNFGHALGNTLVPVITITGLQVGSIIAFSIITEQVFSWPGMGQLFILAVGRVDIPIMAAYLILISLLFVIVNLIVDLLYVLIDPRLRDQTG